MYVFNLHIHSHIQTYIHACMHACIHTYIHTSMGFTVGLRDCRLHPVFSSLLCVHVCWFVGGLCHIYIYVYVHIRVSCDVYSGVLRCDAKLISVRVSDSFIPCRLRRLRYEGSIFGSTSRYHMSALDSAACSRGKRSYQQELLDKVSQCWHQYCRALIYLNN